MGTAAICFVFSAASLLVFALPFFPHPQDSRDGWAAFALVWSIPSLSSMFFWFFAGMVFVWLQRIRDAIQGTTKAVERIHRDGLDIRFPAVSPTWPPQR